ncbi:MAG: alpha/beta fold hydrolase [bacterium]|nr:alpha/beta fold hydrolase [bacterium]
MGSAAERRGRRLWKRLIAAYVVLLGASHLWWTARAEPGPTPASGVRRIEVEETDGGVATGRHIELCVRDYEGPGVPLVCLHGSPGGITDFRGLAPSQAEGRRVLVPDLPGFGGSTRDVADYSIEAGAHAVLGALDALEIERVHLLGFSMGGGVALHLAALAPERVASVTMLAAIGVQELELFGSYRLNHMVHGAQLAALSAARWLVPHFGRFDTNPLNVEYARNFYDTDQRPLRTILQQLEQPLLIVHGAHDFLVPAAAAREHHRLVPHSELELYEDAGHFLLWRHTDRVRERIAGFLARVESGTVPARAQAPAERVAHATLPWDAGDAPPFTGPTLLLAMLLLATATLVSEDLACIGAGLLVSQGRLGLIAASLACFAGIFLGDVLLYAAGRLFGRPAIRRAPLSWMVSEGAVERASRWFRERGGRVIFVSRFTPGLRLPTYVAAGVLHTSFTSFAFYFCVAGLLWTPALVGLASWAGSEAEFFVARLGQFATFGVLGLVGLLLLVPRVIVPMFSHRGRRLLRGRWMRWTQFEFWPTWIFYAPIGAYLAWLSLRRGGFARVTAANPGIATGGFVGESKAEILAALGDDPRIPRWVALPAGASNRQERARAFADGVGYPIVLKPDVGQRGSGVSVIADARELALAVAALPVDALLQTYARGTEYGVFYVRRPGAATGELFSITEKRMPHAVGDGERDLERLILDDERAIAMASTYIDANADQLARVPAAGEQVQLVELGTHCRGAIFLDGRAVETPALLHAFDELSARVDGFFFGRYDVRVEDMDAFRRGEGFQVLEINGVSSEAAHVYDPRHGLLYAYRTFFEQWRTAFEIADANIANGAKAGTVRELWRAWRGYRALQREH